MHTRDSGHIRDMHPRDFLIRDLIADEDEDYSTSANNSPNSYQTPRVRVSSHPCVDNTLYLG